MKRSSLVPVVDGVAEAEARDPEKFKEIRRASLATGANERIQLGARGPEQIADLMDSQLVKGLTNVQAQEKLAEHGLNVLQKTQPKSFLRIFVEQINVLNMLVFAAGILCFIQGAIKINGESLDDPDIGSGMILLVIVFLCMGVGAYMEWSCYRVMADVSAMSAPVCKVVRDNTEEVIDASLIVPGDLIVLSMGDVIPADARVVEVTDMLTNEMPLTGEPCDIIKTMVPDDPASPFPSNYLYATTNVVNGRGKGIVVKTGMATEMGKIAEQLRAEDLGLTSVQITLNNIGRLVTTAMVFLVTIIFLISFFLRVDDPVNKCKGAKSETACFLRKSVIRCLFYAVGAIPETLQPAGMVLLVVGCKQMQSVNAATRKLSAVDTLGSCSFVCSDKTGTLTEGKMTAISMFPRLRGANASSLRFYPNRGFNPAGGIYNEDALTPEVRAKLDKMHFGDKADDTSILANYGSAKNASPEARLVRTCAVAMYINSYGTKLRQETPGVFSIEGNMSEGALVVAAAKAEIRGDEWYNRYVRENDMEVPFSSARKMMATVHKLSGEGTFEAISFGREFTHMAVIKGAPDVLLPKICHILTTTSTGYAVDTDKSDFQSSDKEWFESRNRELSDQALRVMCVTVRPLKLDEAQRLIPLPSEMRLDSLVGARLTFMTLLGLMDPPRESAKTAVAKCHLAGMRVAMITGDQRPTAIAIARELGILRDGTNVDECAQECKTLKGANMDTTDTLCKSVVVWARAQPSDKVTIVESLQRQGHVVAMTGDGVNDAGALKKADIGVAMGISGTDVAKGAADIVLLDDRFATIIDAVAEGRRIFGNIQKMVAYLLCVNIFEVVVIALAMIFGWPLPLEDKQLFFANLVTHEFYPWCIVKEPASTFNMAQPPRSRRKVLLPRYTRTLLMPFVLCVYGGLLLITQIIGSYMYLGTTKMEYMLGTASVSKFYSKKHRYLCLHAMTEGETDSAPIICTVRGTTEYGRAGKIDAKKAMKTEFDYFRGKWKGNIFSYDRSFLRETSKRLDAEDWKDRHDPAWLVRCNKDGKLEGSEDATGSLDYVCWNMCDEKPCWTKVHPPADEGDDDPPEKPTLYDDYNIVSWSLRKMRTMFLLSMVLMEFTMMYGFSKYEFSAPLVLQNWLFPIAWPFMLVGLHLLFILPLTVFDQGFAPLGVGGWILSVIIAGIFYASFEGIKIVHRQWFEEEQVNKEAVAKMHAEGFLNAYTGTKMAFEKFPARQPLIEVEMQSRI